MNTPGARQGTFSSLKNLAATLLTIGQTRLELLGNELEIQKLRILRMLVLAQVMLFCAAMAVILLLVLAALMWWEQRVLVMALCIAAFVLTAAACYRALMALVHTPEPLFAATLAELRQDVEHLKAATSHAKTPD